MSIREVLGDIDPDESRNMSESDGFKLDTTGEYLSLNGHPHCVAKKVVDRAMERYYDRIFVENAWFLHENSADIISDGRMFLAPVHIKNHLAYTGTSGFENPTVGVYVMWWDNYPNCAIDKSGNLVWYIAGSPLTGSNACMSVTPEGKSVPMDDGSLFHSVWKSFKEINCFYSDAKKKKGIYTFEEVLIKLRGEEYKEYLDAVRQEMIDLAKLYDNDPGWPDFGRKQAKKVKAAKREQMVQKRQEIADFYAAFSEKEAAMNRAKEEDRVDDYRRLLHELAEFATDFVDTTFSRNVTRICLNDVIEFAK